MTALFSRLGAIFIVVFLFGTAPQLAGQAENSSDSRVPRLPGCVAEPLLDAPFSAEATTTWTPPASSGRQPLSASARYYRDTSGRVRVEFLEGGIRKRVLVAPKTEPPAFLVDTKARTLFKFVLSAYESMFGAGCFRHYAVPLTVNRFVLFYAKPIAEEALGEQKFEGLRVTGTRLTLTLPVTTTYTGIEERWVSPELNLLVYSRREDPAMGIVEHRVRNIRRAEPAADLFDLDDYRDITPAVFGCWSWDNPYAPHFGRSSECDGYN